LPESSLLVIESLPKSNSVQRTHRRRSYFSLLELGRLASYSCGAGLGERGPDGGVGRDAQPFAALRAGRPPFKTKNEPEPVVVRRRRRRDGAWGVLTPRPPLPRGEGERRRQGAVAWL